MNGLEIVSCESIKKIKNEQQRVTPVVVSMFVIREHQQQKIKSYLRVKKNNMLRKMRDFKKKIKKFFS